MFKRRAKKLESMQDLDRETGCYWKETIPVERWQFFIPDYGVADLIGHKVTENADGTITVRPAIEVTSPEGKTVHGHLIDGIWCEEEEPEEDE